MPAEWTAWKLPTTATKIGSGWNEANLNNLLTENNQFISFSSGLTADARVNNFAFPDIPEGATIAGIQFRLKYRDSQSRIAMVQLRVQTTAGTNAGTEQGSSSLFLPVSGSLAFLTVGDETNLFGLSSLTKAQAIDAGFGFFFRMQNLDNAESSPNCEADVAQARIAYTQSATRLFKPAQGSLKLGARL
jgi:hypothetical protein